MIQAIMKITLLKSDLLVDVHNFKLKNLTFSKYNKENEDVDEIINILDFDISNDFNILTVILTYFLTRNL